MSEIYLQPKGADNLDAFNRLRVSSPATVFDSKQIYDKQPLFWDDQQVSGSGTSTSYNAEQASTTIAITDLFGLQEGKRVRQTFRSFNYQTGKSQLVLLTGIIGEPALGITRRIGQFNDDNGFMFLSTPTSLAVGIRSKTSGSVVDTIVNQADWNIDKLDGTGISGITLDPTKTQIFAFDYQWLGVGSVRFALSINGVTIPVHQFNHSNLLDVVYTSSPNLPLRFEIENDGTAVSPASLTHICATVITEGGRQDTGVIRGLNRGLNEFKTLNDTAIYPVIGLRLKSDYLGTFLRYLEHEIICTTTAVYAWRVILKPTIVGTAPTWLDETNSAIQYAYPDNGTTVTGGTILATGIGSDSNQTTLGAAGVLDSDLSIGSSIDGTPDEIFLCVQVLEGGTETFYTSLNYSETF